MSEQPVYFSRESDEWRTPPLVFAWLDASFNFTLDPAATVDNALCEHYFTAQEDGLVQSWAGQRVFVNPPYSQAGMWVKKGLYEAQTQGATVVMLLASRTDTKWYQDCVEPYANEVQWLPGRLKFLNADGSTCKHGAPFPSIVVIFRPPFPRRRARHGTH